MSGNILFLGKKIFEIPPIFQTRPGDLGKKVHACSLPFSALNRSALFALSKCNPGSISSFFIFPPAAEHTLQRNMKENSRRGLKQTRRDRPVCKKKLANYNKCEFSNFFLFQWPKMIISVLATWIIVDCNLAVRVVL